VFSGTGKEVFILSSDKFRKEYSITGNLTRDMQYLNNLLAADTNFDVIYRIIHIGDRQACMYLIDGFCKDDVVQKLLQYFMDITPEKTPRSAHELSKKKIPYVAEELIKQSKELACFHKKSVNTIRVVSFQYKKDIAILWTFLRTGQGNHEVDNMGAAGLGALIDSETGVIISDGYDWLGRTQKYHPDSKIEFKGYQIPKWDELLEMVKNLSAEISQMHCIGWDLSLTDKGWVLVEANARPQCVTIQTFTKKGYKPYYDKMYKLIAKEIEEQEKIMEMN